ncbi:MAG TPA: HTTM domain-containing protein, partial [Salinimicrobium sp.]|nr:HTTM domain-containing protein [Salinimicrobium sp.]
FDLLIIPFLLWKKTRTFAFIAAIFFHLFNSFVFQIGIFPYLALGFTVFFFPTQKINNLFLSNKPHYDGSEITISKYKKILIAFLSLWFVVQISLPLRHWFFKDDVLWTEEGHRLSWRMMLRSKSGIAVYKVIDKATGEKIVIDKSDYLTSVQIRAASTKPDVIWQFAQYLEKEFEKKGKAVGVYVTCWVSINGKPSKQLINSKVDLAAEEWKHFSHHDWILPSSLEE